jgi:hypothetical protein
MTAHPSLLTYLTCSQVPGVTLDIFPPLLLGVVLIFRFVVVLHHAG